jgi:hypothetical protein
MKNKLYYHFYIPDTPSHWELLLYEQLDCIEGSGLHQHCEVEICVSSNQENYKKLEQIIKSYLFLKSSWFDITNNGNHFEGPTLLKLYDECFLYDNVGYIHSKGITSLSKEVNRWRKVLEYGVIEKWKDNINALNKGYDVSGIFYTNKCKNILNKNYYHFSGNFWWARSSYIKILKRPTLDFWKVESKEDEELWNSRHRYEFWISMKNPKVNDIYPIKTISTALQLSQYSLNSKRKTILNFPNEKNINYS